MAMHLKKRAIWFWSWCCWAVVILLPYQFTGTRLGRAILPWAGFYGFTDGGWREYRDEA